MAFIKSALKEAVLNEAGRDENNGKLLTQEITVDAVNNLPVNPVFWSADSIIAPISSIILKNKTASLFPTQTR